MTKIKKYHLNERHVLMKVNRLTGFSASLPGVGNNGAENYIAVLCERAGHTIKTYTEQATGFLKTNKEVVFNSCILNL